jgi:hypothetical protein
MPAATKFNSYSEDKVRGVHNWGTHTFKVMLSNVAPVVTNTIKSNLTEIAAGNGYVAGGPTVPTAVSRTGATTTVTATDQTITATGAIGPFRYASLYNDSAASKNLIAFIDYGSSISLASGESFVIDFDPAGSNVLFTET